MTLIKEITVAFIIVAFVTATLGQYAYDNSVRDGSIQFGASPLKLSGRADGGSIRGAAQTDNLSQDASSRGNLRRWTFWKAW